MNGLESTDDLEATPSTRFSASTVTRVARALVAPTQSETRQRWLQAVAARVVALRPDIAEELLSVLQVAPAEQDLIKGMTIGEVGVCYEAILAGLNRASRKAAGQFFTPDDAAQFMAERASSFPAGVWIDPCCGVGNLAWHLAAQRQDSSVFVRESLILIDRDETALRSAVVLLAADYLPPGDGEGVRAIWDRAVVRDFLSSAPLPDHDYVIVNPPYARDRVRPTFATARSQELFAYFLERIAKTSAGFVAVTPASYVAAPKFAILRGVLDQAMSGGDVFVFDNVPDTLFRGYKFGSSNTSKTNFVRAAVTVCSPQMSSWRITPILRWKSVSRALMFANCESLLRGRVLGPNGEWVKLLPEHHETWHSLSEVTDSVGSLAVKEETPFSLTVGLTPRYYISAAFRSLDRGSKATLFFASKEERDRVAVVLNSSIPYLWWRALDGGVTLPRRVLLSVPVPCATVRTHALARDLEESEKSSLTVKMNAGKRNENIKHPRSLVCRMDREVFSGSAPDVRRLYSEDMFGPPSIDAPPSAN